MHRACPLLPEALLSTLHCQRPRLAGLRPPCLCQAARASSVPLAAHHSLHPVSVALLSLCREARALAGPAKGCEAREQGRAGRRHAEQGQWAGGGGKQMVLGCRKGIA